MYTGGVYDMSQVEDAWAWLLQKINSASTEEVVRIAKVLQGVWFFRNKKFWEQKTVSYVVGMDWSNKFFTDWNSATSRRNNRQNSDTKISPQLPQKWKPPDFECMKLNVDASVRVGASDFSIGLIIRDHRAHFVAGKVMCIARTGTVLEAEATAILEGLKWIVSMQYSNVMIESDSLISVNAIQNRSENFLEVGHLFEDCRAYLHSRGDLSISFVKRQANKVAHMLARFPCLPNCQNVFLSPPLFCWRP